MDLNHRPLPYQGSALTKLSYGPEIACRDYPTPYLQVLWGGGNHSKGLSQRPGTHCTTGDLTPVYGPGSRELQRGGVDCFELGWCEHSQHYGTPVAQPVPTDDFIGGQTIQHLHDHGVLRRPVESTLQTVSHSSIVLQSALASKGENNG